MNTKLDKNFPSINALEDAAAKRLPKFVLEYLSYGMGSGEALRNNRDSLDRISLIPDYIVNSGQVVLETNALGRAYSAPFGVAPVGLGGIAWPQSAEQIATRAKQDNIPFVASTFAMASLESIRQCAGDCAWFQLYRPKIESIESDLLQRIENAGYDVLIVTVDVPHAMRRDHDIRNGFSIPVDFDFTRLLQAITHPAWACSMARSGFPAFQSLQPYVPGNLSTREALQFLTDLTTGHTTPKILESLRHKWPRKLLVKGILDPAEAELCQQIGMDGIIVSNHGGRQLAASPSACEVLPAIRKKVGGDFFLAADGGIRNGLDICRMLSLGADLVMLGRPFYFSVAAMGAHGPGHLFSLLAQELRTTLSQLGCASPSELTMHLCRETG